MPKKYQIYFLVFIMLVGSLFGVKVVLADGGSDKPIFVSLVQLIANPNEYHGELVAVVGYCHLRFEGDALYLHRQDYEQGIPKNAIWLEIGDKLPKESKKLSGKYVFVEGVFNAENKGHFGLFSGRLYDIKRIVHWKSISEREKEIKKYGSSK